MTTQNTYSVYFNNVNDSRTVIENVDFKTARSIYIDTKNHDRFFQADQSKNEKNTGIVTLMRDADSKVIYESFCKKVR